MLDFIETTDAFFPRNALGNLGEGALTAVLFSHAGRQADGRAMAVWPAAIASAGSSTSSFWVARMCAVSPRVNERAAETDIGPLESVVWLGEVCFHCLV